LPEALQNIHKNQAIKVTAIVAGRDTRRLTMDPFMEDVLFPLSVEQGGILVEGVWNGRRTISRRIQDR
jgi:hypothetical protein